MTYYKQAEVNIGLYVKSDADTYIEIAYCDGSTFKAEELSTKIQVALNAHEPRSVSCVVPSSSFSRPVDLYIKISGSIFYHATGVNNDVIGSARTGSGSVNMNYDSLTYVKGSTNFNYCSNNSMFDVFMNTSNGSNYDGTNVISNSNSGNYGTTATSNNSGSLQVRIPRAVTSSANISYKVTASSNIDGEAFEGSFESGYIQVGRFTPDFRNIVYPSYDSSNTDINYKNNPSIISNGKIYFNQIPINRVQLWAAINENGENMVANIECIIGNNIDNINYASKPIAFNYLRPQIKLNSNLKLNFCCNPELTSTNLYYIGTEKLTNTDLVPATDWAKINFKFANLKFTYGFDAISYFYLDIKNYEDLLNYAEDSSNTGVLKFTVSTDSNSNYAPYSMTLYMIKFGENGVEIGTDPSTLLDSHIKKRIPYLAYYNNDIPTYNSINGYNGFSPSDMFYRAGEDYNTADKIVNKALIVLKNYNMFKCSSDNYNRTSRSIEASLKISDIIEATSAAAREHPSIITYLCEIAYLPDKAESGSEHDILIHSSQTYNMFKEYHIINIAMPRTLTENVPLSSPVTTIKDYTTLLETNYPSFKDYDINHNVQTILNTYDDIDDDTRNTVLSKKVFTNLLFYDNPATDSSTGYADGAGKLVTGYNINTGTNINKSIFFDLTENADNGYFTDKITYQNILIANLFGSGSPDDYSKVINWPIDDMFIYWCTDPFDSTTKSNWRSFNFNTPISKNTNFSLMTCSYIDDNTDKNKNFQTTENTYRNLSFTMPDQSNYTNIATT